MYCGFARSAMTTGGSVAGKGRSGITAMSARSPLRRIPNRGGLAHFIYARHESLAKKAAPAQDRARQFTDACRTEKVDCCDATPAQINEVPIVRAATGRRRFRTCSDGSTAAGIGSDREVRTRGFLATQLAEVTRWIPKHISENGARLIDPRRLPPNPMGCWIRSVVDAE
jgi:hypothetical protein